MKSVIDCDGVFEILTRAPFPTGSDIDEAVEAHLYVCHDCRRLADALRPAVGLFHESLADHDSLPEYAGSLAERKPRPASRKKRLVQIGPLAIAGLAACFVLWVLQTSTRRDVVKADPPGPSAHVLPNDDGLAVLAALDLPLSCLQQIDRSHDRKLVIEVAAAPFVDRDEVRYLCCADCHRPKGGGPVSTRYTQAITTACNACHHSASDIGPLGFVRLSRSRLWS